LTGLDAHLQTLQLLSAHIKLLLDAPEHLWRLLERKKYFQAGWLFLLARVVHRALVRDDDQDEENWAKQGIDVMVRLVEIVFQKMLNYFVQEQFPLVQRQWDAVSHFRTQIIHKATLSLRLYTAPSEVCLKYWISQADC
jgi:conserved oligomeric Golgi complex subunit 1